MDRFSFGGMLVDVLVGSRATAGEYALLLVETPPGAPAFAEQHDGATRVLFPLRGELHVVGEGKAFDLHPPDAMALRPGETHLVASATDKKAQYLLVCQPPRYETLVREMGVIEALADIDPTSAADAHAMVTAAARLGIRLVDPARLPSAPAGARPQGRIPYSMMGAFVDEVLDFGERLVVARIETPAGHRIPTHVHPDPICFCALQGEVDVYSGEVGDWQRLSPGQALFLPARVVHGTRNEGDGPARFMVISTHRTREFYHHFAMARRGTAFGRG